NKIKLKDLDKRREWLGQRIDNATLVRPDAQVKTGRVCFGSTVTYIDEDDATHKVRIVGFDEADLDRGEISIGSPMGRALMGKAPGDGVEVETPAGVRHVDIETIE